MNCTPLHSTHQDHVRRETNFDVIEPHRAADVHETAEALLHALAGVVLSVRRFLYHGSQAWHAVEQLHELQKAQRRLVHAGGLSSSTADGGVRVRRRRRSYRFRTGADSERGSGRVTLRHQHLLMHGAAAAAVVVVGRMAAAAAAAAAAAVTR